LVGWEGERAGEGARVAVSWEAITAIATASSALVIAATVLIGYRQIRVAGDQVEHLRKATQLDGTLKIFEGMNSPEFRAARIFVDVELADRMKDPDFRKGVEGSWQRLNEQEHPELVVLRFFEMVGTYARNGLIDPTLVADFCGPTVREMWKKCEQAGYFELKRVDNPYSYENFEYLYDRAMIWFNNNDPPFRSGFTRMNDGPSREGTDDADRPQTS